MDVRKEPRPLFRIRLPDQQIRSLGMVVVDAVTCHIDCGRRGSPYSKGCAIRDQVGAHWCSGMDMSLGSQHVPTLAVERTGNFAGTSPCSGGPGALILWVALSGWGRT